MGIRVQKASGMTEDFDRAKIRLSLMRSGAEPAVADEVVERVLKELRGDTSTKKIYRLAKKYLRRMNHGSSMRYSLKRALFRLGPTGYPFEKYVAQLLKSDGYSVVIGSTVQGACVSHEVDVLATRHRKVSAVECKYHNRTGGTTDVKVAMYVHSRFRDLEPVLVRRHRGSAFSGLLITNTRFTSEALQYGSCAGLGMVSWRYPEGKGLEHMIEKKRLYPVTIISGVQSGLAERLMARGIILVRDLVGMEVADLMEMLGLNQKKAEQLQRRAKDLCLC